jgi:hypothetical protein
MHFTLSHVEFEDRLSLSLLKNEAIHCKNSRKKSKVFKDRRHFFLTPPFSNSRVPRFKTLHTDANQSFQHVWNSVKRKSHGVGLKEVFID